MDASRQPDSRSDIERRPKPEISGGGVASDARFPAYCESGEAPWRAVEDTGKCEPAWALDRQKQIDHCLILLFKTAKQNQAVAEGTGQAAPNNQAFKRP